MIEIRLILLGMQLGFLVAMIVSYRRGEDDLGQRYMLACVGGWAVGALVKALA